MSDTGSDHFDPAEEPEAIREIREIRRRLWEEAGRDFAEYTRRAQAAAERVLKEAEARRRARDAA